MDGMLLLRCLHLRGILMQPVHADLAETRASHTGIYQRNQLWWHTALERLTQHGLLDTSLLQAQRFLPSLFFLLLPLVFLGLCDEPMPHGLLLAVPLVWWLWDYAQGLIEGSSSTPNGTLFAQLSTASSFDHRSTISHTCTHHEYVYQKSSFYAYVYR
jgi:hypothetical protein